MNKFLKFFFLISISVILNSCGPDDAPEVVPLRDYATQFQADIDSLDNFIDTNYMTVDSDFNVIFNEIPTGGTQLSIRNQQNFPLKDTTVNEDGIDYKIYFIKFREGTQKRPTQVDSVHVAYKGVTFRNTQFDASQNPVWFKLEEVISGWSHIIPNFKTGTYNTTSGPNPVTYDNYGAGIMFLPSGLAYYNGSAGSIGTYTPIIFSFKLYELQYRDQDGDGIKSKDERLDVALSSDISYWRNNPLKYDTDADGIPNMYDIDDDADGFLTKAETLEFTDVSNNNKKFYYNYNAPAAIDNLATPNINESRGIPARTGTSPSFSFDYNTPTRVRKHLDKNWTVLN